LPGSRSVPDKKRGDWLRKTVFVAYETLPLRRPLFFWIFAWNMVERELPKVMISPQLCGFPLILPKSQTFSTLPYYTLWAHIRHAMF